MYTLRSSNIWLIQPNDSMSSVTPIDAAGGDSVRYSPAWDMLCLQAYMRERTGHTCEYIDTRLFDSTHDALAKLKDTSNEHSNNVAVLYTTLRNLAHVVEISHLIRRQYPDAIIVLCGPVPTSFPESIDVLPNIDFGLSGDPEIILRTLLEYFDVEQRLKQTAGLLIPGSSKEKNPHWVAASDQLSLPDWVGSAWLNYGTGLHSNGVRIEARLSRGHADFPANRVFTGDKQPIRVQPLESMASLIHRCPGHGIEEVFLTDHPGYWTTEAIFEWCSHLHTFRNSQPWALQMIPREMSDEEIQELSYRCCRRIELIIPSFDPEIRKMLGCSISDKQLNKLVSTLTKNFIKPQLVYWIQGPGDCSHEVDKILHHIKTTHTLDFSVYPFPLNFDSHLYRCLHENNSDLPELSEWLSWARNADTSAYPSDLWSGPSGQAEGLKTIHVIQRKMIRNPWLRLLRFIKRYRIKLLAKHHRIQASFAVRNPDAGDL